MSFKFKHRKGCFGATLYRIIGVCAFAFVLFLVARSLSIMYVDGEQWRKIASTYNRASTKVIYPIRGNIYGADGELLAIESTVQKLRMDFQSDVIKDLPEDSIRSMLYKLSELLSRELSTAEKPIKAADLRRNWQKARKSKYNRGVLLVNMSIPYSKWLKIKSDKLFTDKHYIPLQKSLPDGIESRRKYPYGSLGKRLIGSIYTPDQAGSDLPRGKQGIELSCDSLLRGEKGEAKIFKFGSRSLTFTIKEPVNGADVYTTLDMDKQYLVDSELRKMTIEADPDFSTAILMEVATGKILAISNLQRGSEPGKFYESRNFAVSSLTEPGSTFKTVSLLAALNCSNISPYDSVDVGEGRMRVGNQVLKDWNVARGIPGFGFIDYATAMYRSSNVGIAKLVYRAFWTNGKNYSEAGRDYVKAVRETGICDPMNLMIPGAASHAIVRYPGDKKHPWGNTTLAWMAHGYETQVPPISMLAFYNAIANDGRFMRPYFVTQIKRGDEVIEDFEPQVVREQIAKNPQIIQWIKDILRGVVTNKKGTGKAAQSNIVEICGKTGTALYWDGGAKKTQATFVGFFPYDHPKYSMLVMTRNARNRAMGSAGLGCGGVVKRVAESIVSIDGRRPVDSLYLKPSVSLPFIQGGRKVNVVDLVKYCNGSVIFDKQSQAAEFIRVSPSSNYETKAESILFNRGVVPDVTGFAASDALYLMGKCGFRCQMSGYGTVVEQSVPVGTKLSINSVVKLTLRPMHEKARFTQEEPMAPSQPVSNEKNAPSETKPNSNKKAVAMVSTSNTHSSGNKTQNNSKGAKSTSDFTDKKKNNNLSPTKRGNKKDKTKKK